MRCWAERHSRSAKAYSKVRRRASNLLKDAEYEYMDPSKGKLQRVNAGQGFLCWTQAIRFRLKCTGSKGSTGNPYFMEPPRPTFRTRGAHAARPGSTPLEPWLASPYSIVRCMNTATCCMNTAASGHRPLKHSARATHAKTILATFRCPPVFSASAQCPRSSPHCASFGWRCPP